MKKITLVLAALIAAGLLTLSDPAQAAVTLCKVKDANGASVSCAAVIIVDESGNAAALGGGVGGGGGGDASAANQASQITAANLTNTVLGGISSPAVGTITYRLNQIFTALGSPLQAGGSIGNSAFGISGTLPAYASTPTFNLGTLNGASTSAKQDSLLTALGSPFQAGGALGAGTALIGKVAISQGTVTPTKVTLVAATAQTAIAANANATGARILNWTASPIYLTSGGLSSTPATGAPSDYIPAAASGAPGQWEAPYAPVDGVRVVGASAGDLTVLVW